MELDAKLYDIRHLLANIQIILTLVTPCLLLPLVSIAYNLRCIRKELQDRDNNLTVDRDGC